MQIKLKKLLVTSLTLTVMTLILLLPTFSSSAAGTVFTMSTKSDVKPGDEFTIDLTVSSNEGFAAFDFELHYSNTSLTLVKVEFSNSLKNAGTAKKSDSTSAMPYKLTFAAGNDFTQNTKLATFTFRLADNAKLENHEVYVTGSAVDENDKALNATFQKGGVVPTCSHDTNPSLWVQFNHTEATCTTPSRTYYRCTECLQQKTEIGTSLKPHEYKDHEHKDATCTENGYDKQICKNCLTVVTTKVYEAAGHQFSGSGNVVPPTCMAQGYTISKCTVCSEEVKSDYTDKIDHTMTESSRLAPTCHSVGYIRYTCTVCSHQSETITETVDHSYVSAEVIAPTHINKGYTVYRCKYEGCAQSYNSDYTEILPHTFEYTVVKEPTCTEAGFKTGICTSGCNVTDEVELPATGHVFEDWKVAVEATEFYDGYEERVCIHCQFKETKLVPKLPKEPEPIEDTPKGPVETAVSYITDANHPAIIAVSVGAVIIAIICIAYISIKIKMIK